jgi:integrase
MRAKLTPALVRDATGPVFIWDTTLPGFGLMVTANGHRSWLIQYKHHGVSRRRNLSGILDLAEARKVAKAMLGAAAAGKDPIGEERKVASEAANTLQSVFREYCARDGKKLRSIERQKRDMERLVLPKLGSRPIGEIRRLDVTRLLDTIEDDCGPRMAHVTLAYISKLFNWHATRDESFRTPLVRGMGRIASGEGDRDRILTDDELRAVWRACAGSFHVFGPFVRFLLLTGVRRTEASDMQWDEIAGDDWIVPASRMKAKPNKERDHVVPLSSAAREVLKEIPRIGPYVFTTYGRVPIGGFSRFKTRLDRASGVTGWTLHDCRRTARSLLSRAGVSPDVGERCIAHAIGGIRGKYDKYEFHSEKEAAFEALGVLIDRIVHPPADVVVPIRRQG